MAQSITEFQNVPVGKLVFKLGFPAMFAQFLNVLYSIVDRFFVGQIDGSGELALAAIGVCAPAVTAISAFAFMVGIGGSSIMSMKLGEKQPEKAQSALNNGFLLLLVLSVLVTVCALIWERPLLFLLGCSEEMYPFAKDYFSIYVCGTAAVLIGTGLNHYILALGLARQGMFTVSLGAVVNIVFDPILIFCFHLGIKGAAIATVLGQISTLIYVLILICKKEMPIHLKLGSYRLRMMKDILSIGSMSFIITLLDNLIVIFLNIVLRRYSSPEMGDKYIACAAVVQSFMLIAGLPAQGICSGCGTIFSFFYGAKDYKKIQQAFRYLLLFCMAFMGLLFLAVQILPESFAGLFLKEPSTIEIASAALKKYTYMLPCIAVQFAFVQGMTSMGKIAYAFPMSVFRKVLYIVLVFTLPIFTKIENVFYSGSISDFLGAAFTLALFIFAAAPKLKKELLINTSIKETR